MAILIFPYDHTLKLLIGQEVSLTDLKLILLDDTAVFDPSDTDLTDVADAEVHGNGWTQGGEPLTSVTASIFGTNGVKLDADDIEKTATSGAIGPAYYGDIYDSSTDKLLARIDFDGPKEAGEGTPFKITWDANGFFIATYPDTSV